LKNELKRKDEEKEWIAELKLEMKVRQDLDWMKQEYEQEANNKR